MCLSWKGVWVCTVSSMRTHEERITMADLVTQTPAALTTIGPPIVDGSRPQALDSGARYCTARNRSQKILFLSRSSPTDLTVVQLRVRGARVLYNVARYSHLPCLKWSPRPSPLEYAIRYLMEDLPELSGGDNES
ncbi:hypothetical protein EVAR_59163_1 [Eumeta japonica]|uniref:Uncharacterized protein n=1 Tax=Eumeta variegata TaxID=151549 RepID=A0A4C1YXZ7_EUMVA|nr:hypothetical protein EVAR_59163_1 [Eumeta japonica]